MEHLTLLTQRQILSSHSNQFTFPRFVNSPRTSSGKRYLHCLIQLSAVLSLTTSWDPRLGFPHARHAPMPVRTSATVQTEHCIPMHGTQKGKKRSRRTRRTQVWTWNDLDRMGTCRYSCRDDEAAYVPVRLAGEETRNGSQRRTR